MFMSMVIIRFIGYYIMYMYISVVNKYLDVSLDNVENKHI